MVEVIFHLSPPVPEMVIRSLTKSNKLSSRKTPQDKGFTCDMQKDFRHVSQAALKSSILST